MRESRCVAHPPFLQTAPGQDDVECRATSCSCRYYIVTKRAARASSTAAHIPCRPRGQGEPQMQLLGLGKLAGAFRQGANLPGADIGVPADVDVVAADLRIRDGERVALQPPYLHLQKQRRSLSTGGSCQPACTLLSQQTGLQGRVAMKQPHGCCPLDAKPPV